MGSATEAKSGWFIEAAQTLFSQEELKSAMGEAGVTAPPTFVFANEA